MAMMLIQACTPPKKAEINEDVDEGSNLKEALTFFVSFDSGDSWTHIGITYEGLGGESNTFALYLNGEKMGDISGVNDPFSWDLDNAKIYLGLSYIGAMDEVAIFNRPLSEAEIKEVYTLAGGIKSIL